MLMRNNARTAVAAGRDSGRRVGPREVMSLWGRHEPALIRAAREGDAAAHDHLIRKYRFLVRLCAREFFAPGHEHDDLAQAGYLGLMGAIARWDDTRGMAFQGFARMAIRAEILNFVAAANRRKAQVLTSATRLHGTPGGAGDEPDEATALADVLPAHAAPGGDPWATLEAKTTLAAILGALPSLSAQQREALTLSLNDRSRIESAGRIGVTPKAIDNSLRKGRAKLAAAAAVA
jgi:RNA polymerase sigma factor (sigma-70 family)